MGNGFLYSNGTIQMLTSLIPTATGWTNLNATGINDQGQIVGQGTINGQQHAFLMTPGVPEPGRLRSGPWWERGHFSWRGDVGYKPEAQAKGLSQGYGVAFACIQACEGRVRTCRPRPPWLSSECLGADLTNRPGFSCISRGHGASARRPDGRAPSLGRQSDPQHFFAPAQAWPRAPTAIGTTGRTCLAGHFHSTSSSADKWAESASPSLSSGPAFP